MKWHTLWSPIHVSRPITSYLGLCLSSWKYNTVLIINCFLSLRFLIFKWILPRFYKTFYRILKKITIRKMEFTSIFYKCEKWEVLTLTMIFLALWDISILSHQEGHLVFMYESPSLTSSQKG